MSLYTEIAKLADEGVPFVVATVVESQGSTPQKPGSKMVVLADGTTHGTVGGGAIELQIIEAAKVLFSSTSSTNLIETHLTHDLGMCCGGRMKVFIEKHSAAAKLWIFGAGHVGRELAVLANRVGFRVTVVDERPAWASRERFANTAELVLGHPADVAREHQGGADCYFCVVTHDHPLDQACVEALLRKPSAYLGMIGSQRKVERFRMRLTAAGFSDQELSRMHSPMGLPINAVTPAEIAVSVVAELVATRHSCRIPTDST